MGAVALVTTFPKPSPTPVDIVGFAPVVAAAAAAALLVVTPTRPSAAACAPPATLDVLRRSILRAPVPFIAPPVPFATPVASRALRTSPPPTVDAARTRGRRAAVPRTGTRVVPPKTARGSFSLSSPGAPVFAAVDSLRLPVGGEGRFAVLAPGLVLPLLGIDRTPPLVAPDPLLSSQKISKALPFVFRDVAVRKAGDVAEEATAIEAEGETVDVTGRGAPDDCLGPAATPLALDLMNFPPAPSAAARAAVPYSGHERTF